VIADFDGDGEREFATAGRSNLAVFDLSCLPQYNTANRENCRIQPNAEGLLWKSPIQGSQTGASVFDFDGDGVAEVVHADQCFMRIYDGPTGKVLFSVPRSSTTQWEYPVIADVDADNHTEIVVGSNDNDVTLTCPTTDPVKPEVAFRKTHGITVWAEVDDKWVNSRSLWNQQNYNIVNINDDGSVPRSRDVVPWYDPKSPNNYRQNSQGSGPARELPDLTVTSSPTVECVGENASVVVSVCNRGTAAIPAGQGTFTATPPATETTARVCTGSNSRELAPGACQDVVCNFNIRRGAPAFDAAMVADAAGQIAECLETNNTATIASVGCRFETQ
jgi:hypothetical protein